jgi:hypothetical protein
LSTAIASLLHPRGLASGHSAAGEPAQQLFGVKAESVEQVGVLVGVGLIGELLGGLVRLLGLLLDAAALDCAVEADPFQCCVSLRP